MAAVARSGTLSRIGQFFTSNWKKLPDYVNTAQDVLATARGVIDNVKRPGTNQLPNVANAVQDVNTGKNYIIFAAIAVFLILLIVMMRK